MRFKIGDKVEVLNRREDPTSSWWCAEIMSGNGHNYYVRYDRDLPDVGSAVERVPRKAIRPCPPSVKGRLDWVPGDFVEVLNNFSWKHAKIIMFSRREYFVVRLLGSSTELSVRSSNIRLRQCWQDNKWVVFRKDSAKCSDKTTNVLSKEKFISEEPQIVDDQFLDKKNISFEDTSQIFTVSVKKRLRSSHPLERCNGAFRKKRAVEKDGCPQGIFAWNSTTWEKVDAVASPQTMFGEKYMHSSLINRNTGNFEANQGVGIANADGGHFSRLMLEGPKLEACKLLSMLPRVRGDGGTCRTFCKSDIVAACLTDSLK